jgi:hypothetical protein
MIYDVNNSLCGKFNYMELPVRFAFLYFYCWQQAGIGELVAIAWGITLFVFVGLTLFVAYSDIDFSFLGLFLPVCLLVFILWGFTAMIFGFKLGYVYAAIGALLFSAYIIYDTFNSKCLPPSNSFIHLENDVAWSSIRMQLFPQQITDTATAIAHPIDSHEQSRLRRACDRYTSLSPCRDSESRWQIWARARRPGPGM